MFWKIHDIVVALIFSLFLKSVIEIQFTYHQIIFLNWTVQRFIFAEAEWMSQSALTWRDSDECALTTNLERRDSACPLRIRLRNQHRKVLALNYVKSL